MAIEPAPTLWTLPDPRNSHADIIAVGGDLAPGTLLAGYRSGMFPMHIKRRALAWWSPEPRGVLPLGALKVSDSLRRSAKRYEIRVDTAFETVLAGCADPGRPHGWITSEVATAYSELHALGWVHSVEAWSRDTGELEGGLYGVSLGGLFAGESMFHRGRDASKAALLGLVGMLCAAGRPEERLLDVQWSTPHLNTLGVVEIPKDEYLCRLARALELPDAFERAGA